MRFNHRTRRRWLFIGGVACATCMVVLTLSTLAFQVSTAKPLVGFMMSDSAVAKEEPSAKSELTLVARKRGRSATGLTRAARRNFFLGHNIVVADNLLKKALRRDPDNQGANFLRSITRIFRLLEEQQDGSNPSVHTDSLKELFDQFGINAFGRTVFALDLRGQPGPDGNVVFPPGSPTGGDLQQYLKSVVLVEIDGALHNLAKINCFAFNIVLRSQEVTKATDKEGIPVHRSRYSIGLSPFGPVEVDCADVRFWQAFLYGLKAGLLTLLAFDLNVDIDAIYNSLGTINVQHDVLNAYPSCLTLTPDNPELLERARLASINGLNAYLAGSEFIRKYELTDPLDPQEDELITIEPSGAAREAELRELAGQLLLALNGSSIVQDELVNLDPFFSAQVNPRRILPGFGYDTSRAPHSYIEPGTFPDPGFNGVLPWMTQARLAEALKLETQ